MAASRSPVRPVVTRMNSWCPIVYSVLCHQHFFLDIVLFSYPIISTKCSSVFLASGDKKKAITLEIKLEIIAQLWANISVLSTFRVGLPKLRCSVV